MNEAFLMKILWNLIHKPDDLWCKVLLSKYRRNNDVSSSCSSQPYDSSLWKALSKVWHNFQRHVVRQIGNGRNTNFWLDKWVPHNVELLPLALRDQIDTTLSVRDVLNQDGDWDVGFLSENLSNDIVTQVIALPTPTDVDGPDILGWAGTNTHQFTVKSAYTLNHAIAMPHVAEGDWKTLWGWKGPRRIQTFMWKWIFDNLNKKGIGAYKDGWQTTFMTTCWLLWTKPPDGWIKLNSDGACKGNNGISGCRGLFRNSDGRWIKGYTKKIESCGSFHAEMWGLYLGLDMAWRDHISYLIVESDSKLLIDMITGNCTIGGVIPLWLGVFTIFWLWTGKSKFVTHGGRET
ncbi:hypothetical protein TSUD_404370 [Trifolium subterraneum]|uniref:RNase H type-1 domain-containing protein n=1 Tax=Trifolium subterraneum TaxID=3900 RepID=A0A2Z6NWK8_TRISU|nr:hypothetical protein TSUD_404370 [Trifolium subterraneum]